MYIKLSHNFGYGFFVFLGKIFKILYEIVYNININICGGRVFMRKKIELLILSFIAALAIVLGIAQTTKAAQINNDQKVVTLRVSRVATFLFLV